MNIKKLREKTKLSQKAFGEALGLSPQSILNYEAGKNVPETVKKLVRYEYAKYLPEEERLLKTGLSEGTFESEEINILKKENEFLKQQVSKVKDQEDYITVLKENIVLLKEQMQHYKDQLNIADNRSKTA